MTLFRITPNNGEKGFGNILVNEQLVSVLDHKLISLDKNQKSQEFSV